jgi:hypothetical protein
MTGRTSKRSAEVANKAAAAPHRAKSARRGLRKRVAAKAATSRKAAPKSQSRKGAKPALLSGGNPQIAKAYGDAPVQAYIAAMASWKHDVGRRLDALIVSTVPGVSKCPHANAFARQPIQDSVRHESPDLRGADRRPDRAREYLELRGAQSAIGT